jgi:hypothetical protein
LLSLNALAGRIAELKQARDAAQDRYRLISNQVAQARSHDAEVLTGNTNVRVIQQPDLPTRRSNSLLLLMVGAIIAGIVLSAVALFTRITTRRVLLDASEAAASTATRVIVDLREPELGGPVAAADARERLMGLPRAASDGGHVIALLATRAEDYDPPLWAMLRQLESEGSDDLAVVHFEPSAYGPQRERFEALAEAIPAAARVQVSAALWESQESAPFLSALREKRRWIVLLGPQVADRVEAGTAADRMLEHIIAAADDVLLVIHVEHTTQQAARDVAARTVRLGRPLSGLIVTGRRIAWPRLLEEA